MGHHHAHIFTTEDHGLQTGNLTVNPLQTGLRALLLQGHLSSSMEPANKASSAITQAWPTIAERMASSASRPAAGSANAKDIPIDPACHRLKRSFNRQAQETKLGGESVDRVSFLFGYTSKCFLKRSGILDHHTP